MKYGKYSTDSLYQPPTINKSRRSMFLLLQLITRVRPFLFMPPHLAYCATEYFSYRRPRSKGGGAVGQVMLSFNSPESVNYVSRSLLIICNKNLLLLEWLRIVFKHLHTCILYDSHPLSWTKNQILEPGRLQNNNQVIILELYLFFAFTTILPSFNWELVSSNKIDREKPTHWIYVNTIHMKCTFLMQPILDFIPSGKVLRIKKRVNICCN